MTGADGTRTHDLLVANQALSQLSYGPLVESCQAEKLSAAILTGASATLAGQPEDKKNSDQHQGTDFDPLHRRGTLIGPGRSRTCDFVVISDAL